MEIVHRHDAPPGARASLKALPLALIVIVAIIAAVSVVVMVRDGRFGGAGRAIASVTLRPAAAAKTLVGGLDPDSLTVSDPKELRALSPEQAMAMNANVPTDNRPNPAAQAFALPLNPPMLWTRSVDCMTAAIYYEAANEPTDGQRAVAQVVLNRVRHPVYPHSVCGVVFQGAERSTGCQFSFTCDGSMKRAPIPSLWTRARGVAMAALAGYVFRPVGWATHYHADYVVPYWASSLVKVNTIGRHIFYRWSGSAGVTGAFSAPYAGNEPDIWADMTMVPASDDLPPTDLAGSKADITLAERPVLSRSGSVISAFDGNGSVRPLSATVNPATNPAQAGNGARDVPSGARWILSGPAHGAAERREAEPRPAAANATASGVAAVGQAGPGTGN